MNEQLKTKIQSDKDLESETQTYGKGTENEKVFNKNDTKHWNRQLPLRAVNGSLFAIVVFL